MVLRLAPTPKQQEAAKRFLAQREAALLTIHPEAAAFTHDCDECVYLGPLTQGPTEIGFREGRYDLYVCERNKLPTVVARYGDDGCEYYSGMGTGYPMLKEAEYRAHWYAQLSSEFPGARCEALWYIPLEFPEMMPDRVGADDICICDGRC